MRHATIPVLALLVLSALAATGRGAADAPRWTVGDFWKYDVDTTVEAGLVLNGTVTATVVHLGPKTVKGVPVTVFETILAGGGSVRGSANGPRVAGTWSYAGEQWVDAAGFKVVRSVSQIDANGTATPFDFSFQVQNTTENEVRSDTWHYPVDVGTTGTFVTNTTSSERIRVRFGVVTDEMTATATYERTLLLNVTSAPEVRVAAGSFASFDVRVGWPSGEVDHWFYAPAVGNNARTETYNETGAKIAESSLRSFRYQAAEASPSVLGLPPLIAYVVSGGAVAGAALAILVVRQRRRVRDVPPTAGDDREPRGPT